MKVAFKFLYRQLARSFYEDYNFKLVSSDEPKFSKRREIRMLKKGSIAILSFFLVAAISLLFSNIIISTQAQSEGLQEVVEAATSDEGPEIEISSNEILIKIKKSVKDKVKEGNAKDLGIASLSQINREIDAKDIDKVVKEDGALIKNQDIFSWYKITLEAPQEKIKIKNKKILDEVVEIAPEGTPSAELTISGDDTNLKRIARAIKKLKNDPNVLEVIPNYTVDIIGLVPNDPFYASSGTWGQAYDDLWGLKKIDSENGWSKTTGLANIVVAVIDSGVDYNHADLSGNIWTNNDEIPNNSIDDDNNGYIDDYYGWDFVNNDNDPMDDLGHGTHIAGTIGAVGNNNLGVVGVNWNVSIMGVKFIATNGSGNFINAVNAIVYAADNGADISNYSFRGPTDQLLQDAVDYADSVGVIQIAGAGNDGNDVGLFSPGKYANTITVAATDSNDVRPSWSNFGEEVDVAAPGVDILSLKSSTGQYCSFTKYVANYYCRSNGTSFSTSHVSGLAALILSHDLSLDFDQVKQIITSSADDIDALGEDDNTGAGRINVAEALSLVNPLPSPTPTPTPPPSYLINLNIPERYCNVKDVHLRLTWTENIGTDYFDIYRDDVGWYTNNNNEGDIWESEPLAAPKVYKFRVRNHDPILTGGVSIESNEATMTVQKCVGILGTVISTELLRQGLVSEEVWEGDTIYGALIAKNEPQIMKGYHFWAQPVVMKMRSSELFTKLVQFIATPVLTQIAYEAGTVQHSSLVGNIILESGKMISSGVGVFVDSDVRYSTASQ